MRWHEEIPRVNHYRSGKVEAARRRIANGCYPNPRATQHVVNKLMEELSLHTDFPDEAEIAERLNREANDYEYR